MQYRECWSSSAYQMSMNSADNRVSTKVSKSSTYLSSEENELVFRLVGRRCVTQCTTVAQMYTTEGPSHSRWIRKHTGALCFVKDNAKRSYYCRIYCLVKHELLWEQEMYDTIDIARTRPYLLTFEGQVILSKRDNLHKMFEWVNEAIHTWRLWGDFSRSAFSSWQIRANEANIAKKSTAMTVHWFAFVILGRHRGSEFCIRGGGRDVPALCENDGR